jgi:16S rRNA (adenine1518-N6/adenine1519-N6)-dimethyltransferase
MDIEDLPPLRDIIQEFGLSARKSLGQNFLFDINLTRRIARAAAPLVDGTIIEVGPGPGGLTRALLIEGASKVIAIETDTRAIEALSTLVEAAEGRLTLIAGDALQQEWETLAQGKAKIVANLPYNIATPLLVNWMTGAVWPPWWDSLTIMLQREVAERLVAKPRTSQYGRLSVMCQWRSSARLLFDVHRSAFTPPPKVTSSIVQIEPTVPISLKISPQSISRVTAAAFGQRRKMLRSSLKSVFDHPTEILEKLGIDETMRAEELTVAQYAALAEQTS